MHKTMEEKRAALHGLQLAVNICRELAYYYAETSPEEGSRQHGKVVAANSCADRIESFMGELNGG